MGEAEKPSTFVSARSRAWWEEKDRIRKERAANTPLSDEPCWKKMFHCWLLVPCGFGPLLPSRLANEQLQMCSVFLPHPVEVMDSLVYVVDKLILFSSTFGHFLSLLGNPVITVEIFVFVLDFVSHEMRPAKFETLEMKLILAHYSR
ncbi:hypothetical protein ACFE04_019765 [Oxalis oulophora]